jgi:predicted ATPase
MVIEDLHWCDDVSLEWLLYLARHLKTQPVLLVMSYRSDEVQPSLQHLLAELNRVRLAVELKLEPLSVNNVDQMLQMIFDLRRPVDSDFLQTMSSLPEGNPFYIEEALKSLLMLGDVLFADVLLKPLKDLHIPNTIRNLVQRRSQQLTSAAHHTLTVASVIGRRFIFPYCVTCYRLRNRNSFATSRN